MIQVETLVEWHPYSIPMLVLVIGILISLLAKRKDDLSPAKNQIYVGQALVLSSISATTVYVVKALVTKNSEAGIPCLYLLLGYVIVLLVLAILDSRLAWRAVTVNGVEVHERKWWVGILIPNASGWACFFLFFEFAKSRPL